MTVKKAEETLPLNVLQHWMQTVLVNPLGTDNGHPWQLLPENMQDDLEKIVAPSSRLSSRQRLAIYQRGYLARLRDCMAGQFRALQFALGEELFQAFADEYLQQYPSVSYTLADLGRRFAGFLQATRPDGDAPENKREDWPDFMIELAQLEYALLQIFDENITGTYKLADENTADDKLQLAPIFHLFSFRFPTAHYLQAVHRDERPTLPFEMATYLAVTRKDFQLGLFHLNPLQHSFLTQLQAKPQPIAAALVDFSLKNTILPADMQSLWAVWRTKWIEAGFFITK